MIEIAPKKYHISCSYDEAVLYCFQLEIDGKIGWRLPTKKEYINNDDLHGWYRNDTYTKIERCIPVRDI